jgi:hypothetical protein
MKYQERVSTVGDLKALYEKVVKDPHISHYRGYTDEYYYGWDSETYEYEKNEDCDTWYPNPSYVAPPRTEKEIIKGVVCCCGAYMACNDECPYANEENCNQKLKEDILKLIADKNARIKELSGDTELE